MPIRTFWQKCSSQISVFYLLFSFHKSIHMTALSTLLGVCKAIKVAVRTLDPRHQVHFFLRGRHNRALNAWVARVTEALCAKKSFRFMTTDRYHDHSRIKMTMLI